MTTQTEIQTKLEIQQIIKTNITDEQANELFKVFQNCIEQLDPDRNILQEVMTKMIAGSLTVDVEIEELPLIQRISTKYPILDCYLHKIISPTSGFIKIQKFMDYISMKGKEEYDPLALLKSREMFEIKERQLKRKELYKNLPRDDMWKGRSKLAYFINHCARFMNYDFKTKEDEYQAMEILINSYNNISMADFKTHFSKWLKEFVREFGLY